MIFLRIIPILYNNKKHGIKSNFLGLKYDYPMIKFHAIDGFKMEETKTKPLKEYGEKFIVPDSEMRIKANRTHLYPSSLIRLPIMSQLVGKMYQKGKI